MSEAIRDSYGEVLRAMDAEAQAAAKVADQSTAVKGLLLVYNQTNSLATQKSNPKWRPTTFWPVTEIKLGSRSTRVSIACPAFYGERRERLVVKAMSDAHVTQDTAEIIIDHLQAQERSFLGFLGVGLGILTYHPHDAQKHQLRISSAKAMTPESIMSPERTPHECYKIWRTLIAPLGIQQAIDEFPAYGEKYQTIHSLIDISGHPLALLEDVPTTKPFQWENYVTPADVMLD